MVRYIKGLAGAGAMLIALSGPALAQDAAAELPDGPAPEVQALIDGLPQEADRNFWCASAFALLASVSENPAEAQGLGASAQNLVLSARELLPEQEYSDADFQEIASGYNLIVLAQFESQDESVMPYSPDDCLQASGVPAPDGGGAPQALPEAPAQPPLSDEADTPDGEVSDQDETPGEDEAVPNQPEQ